MQDLLVALGLMFVIEGLTLAAFPNAARQAMEALLAMSDSYMRISGVAGAVIGVLVVWLARG